jgi:hypothetical protein
MQRKRLILLDASLKVFGAVIGSGEGEWSSAFVTWRYIYHVERTICLTEHVGFSVFVCEYIAI